MLACVLVCKYIFPSVYLVFQYAWRHVSHHLQLNCRFATSVRQDSSSFEFKQLTKKPQNMLIQNHLHPFTSLQTSFSHFASSDATIVSPYKRVLADLPAVITRNVSAVQGRCSGLTGSRSTLHSARRRCLFQATALLCLPLFGSGQSLWPQFDQLLGIAAERTIALHLEKGEDETCANTLLTPDACSCCTFSPRCCCKCTRRGKAVWWDVIFDFISLRRSLILPWEEQEPLLG